MRVSSLSERLAPEQSVGWDVLFEAWEARESGSRSDVIILAVGDPDFDSPAPVVDAAVKALCNGDTHYGEIAGRPALRQLIAERFSKQTGLQWGPENAVPFAGTQNALFAASACLLEAGDEVIAFDPMYLTYASTLTFGGAEVRTVALDAERGFRIDADRLAEATNDRTRAIVLNTPNNPTGAMASREELEAVAELARARDLWVIADEVYSDLVFDAEHVSIASLDGMADRTVTVSSLSKSHAMTGWRIGWAIAPTELSERFERLHLVMSYGLPGFVQAAAIEALTSQDQTVVAMREAYRRRRDLALAELAGLPGAAVMSPQAGMYVLLDVRSIPTSDDGFAWDLYRATGVVVVDGAAFGANAAGWVRISFAVGDDELAEGCRRIRSYIESRLGNS